MPNPSSPGDVVRKLLLFAALGFAAITLGGPVLAVLSVLLSFGVVAAGFVLLGGLVWFGVRALVRGPQTAWEEVHGLGHGLARMAPPAGRHVARVARFPVAVARHAVTGAAHGVGFLARKSFAAARFVGEVGVVTVTGVVVGVAVGVVTASQHNPAVAVVTNAVYGGLIGTAAGAVMAIADRRAHARQAPPQLS